MIVEVHVIVTVGCDKLIAHGVGSRRAISRSKRRNRMATRKKRMENGRRADPSGSNPHSYGESFSMSGNICGSQKLTSIKIREINVVKISINIRFTTFSQVKLGLDDWKSSILIILKK